MSCNNLTGCSFFGVGMKLSPFDSKDVSPGVNLYLLMLVMWVRVLWNLLLCFVSLVVDLVCFDLLSLCFFFLLRSWDVSLEMFSIMPCILFHCAGDVSNLTLFLIGSSSSVSFFALSYPVFFECLH